MVGVLAVVGFAVGVADLLGWLDEIAPEGVATPTLLLASGVIVIGVSGISRVIGLAEL